MTDLSLPTGRTGSIVALGLTLLALAVLWWGIAAPLAGWYAARSDLLTQRTALLGRMDMLVATLPALRRQASAKPADGTVHADALLQASSDATAGAALQQRVQDMAAKAGVSLATVETLPGQQAGALRRIALRVGTTATWPALVHLLQAIEQSDPRMSVDDLQLRSSLDLSRPQDPPINASFSVVAFRVGNTP